MRVFSIFFFTLILSSLAKDDLDIFSKEKKEDKLHKVYETGGETRFYRILNNEKAIRELQIKLRELEAKINILEQKNNKTNEKKVEN
jgi:hypothetical protein